MTSTALRQLSTERPSTAVAVAKAVAVVLVGAAGLFAAFWAGFVALVLVTGCFLECSPPPPSEVVGGLALAGLAVGLAASGPLLAAALYRSRAWLLAAGAVAGPAVVALLVVWTNW